jgi:hypothetical protein
MVQWVHQSVFALLELTVATPMGVGKVALPSLRTARADLPHTIRRRQLCGVLRLLEISTLLCCWRNAAHRSSSVGPVSVMRCAALPDPSQAKLQDIASSIA